MKVAEYRKLYDRLSDALSDYWAAEGPRERAAEADRCRRLYRDLGNASCPRAGNLDRRDVARLLATAAEHLASAPAAVSVEHDQRRDIWALILTTGKRIEFHGSDSLERFRARTGV